MTRPGVAKTMPGMLLSLALHVLFVISGFCGLAYEVLWLRQVGLLVGTDGGAVGVVTAAFMGGMGLGYAAAGRWVSRLKRPIWAFGLLEVGTGALALLLLLEFRFAPTLLQGIASIHPSLASSLAVRASLAALFLLPPTALMGATLPVLCKPLARPGRSVGYSVGTLYAANLAGAAGGALFAGMWMLENLGSQRSSALIAAVSVGVGLAGLLASRMAGERPSPPLPEDPREAPPVVSTGEVSTRWIGLTAAVLCGAVSMGFQVLWVRCISLFAGSTAWAFTMALAVFLVGLTVGSQAVSLWLRRGPSPTRVMVGLGVLVGLLGLTVVLATFGLSIWFQFDSAVTRAMPRVWTVAQDHWVLYPHFGLTSGFRLALITVLPATICSGAIMPLVAHLARRQAAPGWVGASYSLNTGGAVVGGLLAQFVLMPLFGVGGGLFFFGAAAVAGAMLVIWRVAPARPSRRLEACVLLGVLLLCCDLAGPMRPMRFFVSRMIGGKLAHYKEDPLASVAVFHHPSRVRKRVVLFINGHRIAGGRGEPHFARLTVGCVKGRPRRVAVIGLGAGGTCEGAAEGKGVKVECIEILPAVIAAQPLFRKARNRRRTRPPNVTYVSADGRLHMATGKRRYDAIIVDGTQVVFSGGYSLITREFFQLAANRLTPGGVLGVWAGQAHDGQAALARTLLAVFPWSAAYLKDDMWIAGAGPPPSTRDRCPGATLYRPSDIGTKLPGGPILVDDRPGLMFEVLRMIEAAVEWRGGERNNPSNRFRTQYIKLKKDK